MPRVPTYGNQRIETAPVPGVSLRAAPTVASLGGPIAEGVQDLGQASDRIQEQRLQVHLEERQKAEQTALMEADRQLGDWENRALYDSQNGALAKRGTDAFAAPETTLADFDSTTGEIEKGLVGNDVKVAFRRAAGERRLGVDRTLQRHVAGEREAYRESGFKAYIETSQSTALSAAGDPARVDQEIARQQAAIEEFTKGQAPEVRQRMASEASSSTYAGVVARLLDGGQSSQARAEFARVKDKMLPEDAARLTKGLEVAGLREDSQRLVDELMAKTGEDGAPIPLDVALLQVAERTKDNPELRAEAEQRLVSMHGLRQRAKQEEGVANYRKAYDIATAPDNGRGIDAIPPTLWSRLEPQYRDSLKANAARRDRGEQLAKDSPAFLLLLRDSATDPAKFAKLNLLDKINQVHPSDLAELQKIQNEIIKGNASAGSNGRNAGILTAKETVDNLLDAKAPGLTGKEADPARRDAFYLALDKAVRLEDTSTGKHPTPDRVRAIAEQLLIEHTVTRPGSWFGWTGMTTDEVKVPTFELKPEDEARLPGDPAPDRYVGQGDPVAGTEFDATVSSLRQDPGMAKAYDGLTPADRAKLDSIFMLPASPKNDRLRGTALDRLRSLAGR